MQKRKLIIFATLAALTFSAMAAKAPWYIWKSKLNGKTACAQTMQGEWEKVGGPFKDARCEKPGTPN